MKSAFGLVFAVVCFVLASRGIARANPSMLNNFNFDHPTFEHPHAFATHHVVIQVSQGDPARWNLVLNNAQNLLEAFGDDKVQIVVVTYGPGLKMLFPNSPVAKRVAAMDQEGIEFDACHKTMEAMARKLGHMPKLEPTAMIVPGGLVRIMQLEKAGFDYIKP